MQVKKSAKTLKTGTICLVRFHPSVGSELKKYRPAVIASELPNKIDPRFALIIPLTTQIKPKNKAEILIKNKQALEKDSLLLCWYFRIIDRNRIVSNLGKLNKNQTQKMKQEIRKMFA